MSLSRFLQYAFIAIVTVTVGFSLYQWNASRAANKINTSLNLNTNGLVGHWTFDGADTNWTSSTAGTTNDTSGSGNTGTLTNMNRATTPTLGKVGQAMNFDGTNDYVNLGTPAALGFTDTSSEFTITAWVKPTVTARTGIVKRGATTSGGTLNQYELGTYTNNNLEFVISDGATAQTITSDANTLPLNTWSLVSCGMSTTTLQCSVNGVSVATAARTINASSGNTTTIIGSARTDTSFFTGAIDDVRVYNRALSSSEIVDLYRMGGAKENTSALQPQGIGNLNAGLTGYWKFDDASGTTAADSSGNGNTGTLVSTPTWITGQIGGGLTFNGSNYVSTTQVPLTSTVPNGFSTFVWLQASNAPAWVYEMGDSSALVLMTSSTGTYCRIRNVDSAFFDSPRSTITGDGNWHHFGCVFDRGINVLALYVDGVSVGTVSTSGFTSFDEGAAPFYLGGRSYGSNGVGGSLDEMRIYNRALSADEISRLYQVTTPTGVDTSLKGYWPFDGKTTNWTSSTTGTTADLSSFGNTGTLTNMNRATTPVIGKLGQALDFIYPTANTYVTIPAATSINNLETQGGGGMTVAAWIKQRSAGEYSNSAIVSKGPSVSIYNGSWRFHLQGSAGLGFAKSYSTTSLGRVHWSGMLTLNTWNYVVATWDGSAAATGIHLYSNGVEASTYDISQDGVGTKVADTANSLSIGGPQLSSYGFDGNIDEVRVFNRVLSQAEIIGFYQTGKKLINTTQNIDTNGLVGHWTLDGKDTVWSSSSAGTTLDTSGNGNTGTLTNMNRATSPVIGKLGQAMDFVGSGGQKINIGSPASLDDIETQGGGGMTISTWINPRTSGAGEGTIINKGNAANSSNGAWSLKFYNSIGRFGFEKSYGTTVLSRVALNGTLSYNKWQHVVTTWDGSATGSNIHIYVDGVEASYQATTDGVGSKVSDAANSISINDGVSSREFDGKIDDVRIYNRVLTASEISALYTSTR